ncbi:hypothetical protein STEG23_029286, partial [Scotinomys teguina]
IFLTLACSGWLFQFSLEVPSPLGSLDSWILEVGARLPRLDCTSSSLESVPCP